MTADPPPQNAYDDPDFFAGYSQLERFGSGWTKAFEHSSFMALLPDVSGRRVYELGRREGHPRRNAPADLIREPPLGGRNVRLCEVSKRGPGVASGQGRGPAREAGTGRS